MPRYNWNIVESGIEQHNPNPPFVQRFLYNSLSANILFWLNIMIMKSK